MTTDMTKKIITAVADDIKDAINGYSIEQAINALNHLARMYGKEAKIEIGEEADAYSYSTDRYAYVRVMIQREETEDEYQARISFEKLNAERQLAADMAAYERVRKAMENGK